ncbi:hypothetical protein NC652_035524 [Populus alba x Populus x berolinensis]|nr:hypothetical protein NC652_035524 [Populus alba x Populus x berolinensis]
MTTHPCYFLLSIQRRKHNYCWGDGEEIWKADDWARLLVQRRD